MAAAILRHLARGRIYVESAGTRAGETDPFAVAAMEDIGIDISRHRPVSFADLAPASFDLIVTLSPEAHHQALASTGRFAVEVEYWPTPDPTLASGNREQILAAYRSVRDGLFRRIKQRFDITGAPTV
jgi:protein-tyrosine-phosphatase